MQPTYGIHWKCLQLGNTALHIACNAGNIIAIRTLLKDSRTDINLKDGNGDYVLHRATAVGNIAVINGILDGGTFSKFNGTNQVSYIIAMSTNKCSQ